MPHPLDPAYFVFRNDSCPSSRTGSKCRSRKESSVDIIGHLKVHVDDLEFSGEAEWLKDIWEPLGKFYKIPVDEVKCAYKGSYKMTGSWVYQDEDYSIRTNQEPYISTLQEIKIQKGRPLDDLVTEAEKKEKMKLDGESMWIGQRSPPSVAVWVSCSVEVNNHATVKDLQYVNKLVRMARKLRQRK